MVSLEESHIEVLFQDPAPMSDGGARGSAGIVEVRRHSGAMHSVTEGRAGVEKGSMLQPPLGRDDSSRCEVSN